MPAVPRLPLPIALAALLAACTLVLAAPSPSASGQDGIASARSAAASLRAAVAAEERKIAATQAGLADAERRLAALQARAQRRQTQLDDTQNKLVRARVHLTTLERKEARAQRLLAANLVASYKDGSPSFVTVVMDANGFADLLERVQFIKRVAARNASILDVTRNARVAVQRQTKTLTGLRSTYSTLAKAAIDDRNQADVVRSALLRREEQQLATRNGTASKLAAVRGRIAAIERRQAAAARAARLASMATTQAPQVNGGGTTTGVSTGGGDGGDVVARVVAAANQIASTPYVWGGGHGGAVGGYDCSGSVSYALAAGGLLSSPLDSTGFESWGEPGPGRRITVYANAVHAFMIVDGRRFDTSALSGGTRWTSASRSTAGFVARHPPGL
jgi:cell wall-associated NlpC family hydrolase